MYQRDTVAVRSVFTGSDVTVSVSTSVAQVYITKPHCLLSLNHKREAEQLTIIEPMLQHH